MEILVVVPAELAHDVASGGGVRVRGYRSTEEILGALGAPADAVVLVSDLVPAEDLAIVASAVRQDGRPAIEVRSAGWDGETQSPLSGVCRGVISGFGLDGVAAAVALLRRERGSA